MNPLNLFRKPLAPWDDQRALIKWNNAEPWTIGDSFEGVQVFGDTGSGKSSTSAKVLAASMLRAGYGGLVLTVKPEDSTDWKQWLAENGRAKDGIFFKPGSGLCFNFLDYELRRGREQGSGSRNAAHILAELISLTQRSSGKVDDFWNQAANEMVSAILELFLAAGVVPSLQLAKEVVDSAPKSVSQTRDPLWQSESRCWALIQKSRANAASAPDFATAENYWLKQFPDMAEKMRSSIVATFAASLARHFCFNDVHRLFGELTNVTPEDIFNGKIIVVDMPVKIDGAAGRFAAIIWKYCMQLAVGRRIDKRRPVFIFADESQHFFTDYDQMFQTTARSSRCSVVYLTQNLGNYMSQSPGEAGRHRVESMCNCLKTRIIHQCSDPATRNWFANAIGKHRITRQDSESTSYGPGKPTPTYNEKLVDDYWVLPDLATGLKTGGIANNYRVTAIVTKAGKMFSNGRPALLALFDQRKFEPGYWPNYTVVAIPKPKK
jgi:hypothetical protein